MLHHHNLHQRHHLQPPPLLSAPSSAHHQTTSDQQPPQKAFVCEICGKAFRFRSNLAEHRSVHTAVKPFVCKFCGKSSRLKGNLTKHILKHHKMEQKEYIGTDDYIIKKGKKSVKDPAAIEFLEKSMIVLQNGGGQHGQQQQMVLNHTEAPRSQQSADSGGTEQSAAETGGDLLDGQGILLSLGLDAGSLDLKAEAMQEEDADQYGDHDQQNSPEGSMPDHHHHNNNERLLEHCESAISGGDTEHPEEDAMEDEDAYGTGSGAEDGSGAECQSSAEQSPLMMTTGGGSSSSDFVLDTSGANALAAAACKALFMGQIDNKSLAKAFLGGRPSSMMANGQKDAHPQYEQQQQQQHQQSTNDEIMRILQQVSSLTAGQQQQQAKENVMRISTAVEQHQQQQNGTANCSNKLGAASGTQCQLCGKHFRKPRDLIAHLASGAHNPGPTSCSTTDQQHQHNNNFDHIFARSAPAVTKTSEDDEYHSAERIPAGFGTMFATSRNGRQSKGGDVSSELRELRNAMTELRTAVGGANKMEQMLSQLDSRVGRLEKQLEMALNSIYTLVQLQTGINNSVQKLASCTTAPATSAANTCTPTSSSHRSAAQQSSSSSSSKNEQ